MDENFNFNPSRPDEFFSDYLDDEMEYDNDIPNYHGAIVSENISTRSAESEELFSVKFIPSLRQFKGQTFATKSTEFTIHSSTVDGFLQKVFDTVSQQFLDLFSEEKKLLFLRSNRRLKDVSVHLKVAMNWNYSLTRN